MQKETISGFLYGWVQKSFGHPEAALPVFIVSRRYKATPTVRGWRTHWDPRYSHYLQGTQTESLRNCV